MYLLLASLAFTYIGGSTFYRLFLHPLSEFPGPTLAALSEGYAAYFNLIKGGRWIAELDRLHKIYGIIGPNRLHFNYPRAYHDIYTFGTTLVKDSDLYHGIGAIAPQSAWATCDPQKAKARRALMAPLFSRRAILELEYTIQQKVDRLISVLEEYYSTTGSSVEVSSAFRSLTADIITSYCFAESPNTLDHPHFDHPLVLSVEGTFKNFWLPRYFPWTVWWIINGPQKLVLWLLPQYKGFTDLRNGLQHQIDRFLTNPDLVTTTEHETVYQHLLAPKDVNKRPTKYELLDDAVIFAGAGSDTVGNAAYVGTYYATREKAISQRLAGELRKAWPNKDKPLSITALEKLPYLTAFIKETLRYSVGVNHPLSRVVGPNTPEIGGLKLPTGTRVEMSATFMHFNSDVFPDPFIFSPDRWLSGETAEMTHDLVPFSKGTRICLGWSELYLIFGNLFRKFNLNLVVDENTYVLFLST
ncbi:hypothetical protein GYMLUDRAFT_171188 [Collybiopsis luxurians FD-317 M1]|uniref:Cytochrome P450 n=1 Tax=Collybiopsis luxurians FD-317 M1 TaxID=944289 RepID=A0A0D0BS87_9AGAR|nr:hypothetical protein GYMLUDRAFT_171188 [Collybiopsis luxurians FD-317 M1]